jgi:hypothetical protein
MDFSYRRKYDTALHSINWSTSVISYRWEHHCFLSTESYWGAVFYLNLCASWLLNILSRHQSYFLCSLSTLFCLLSDGYESANEQIFMDTPLDYYALISLDVCIGLVLGFSPFTLLWWEQLCCCNWTGDHCQTSLFDQVLKALRSVEGCLPK